MPAMRFAQLIPWLQRAGGSFRRNAMPHGALDWTTDVGLNALFGLAGAASLPEGTDPMLRAGAFAEGMASVPIGWLGRGMGYGVGRGIGRLRGRELSDQGMGMLQNFGGAGAEMGLYATGLMPMPFTNRAIEDYNSRMENEQAQQMAARDAAIREEERLRLLQQMGPVGAFASPLQQGLQSFGLMG